MYRIAVAGNPNSGKTSLFNNLTGEFQHVGNYPGVTVEFFEGFAYFRDLKFKLIDLPGTYSLTTYSQEEVVARDYIINEKPDAIINVIDAGNFERNLYFTIQLLELNLPVVIALNMTDIAEKKGSFINALRLSSILGVRVIPTVAKKGIGMEDLKEACFETIHKHIRPKPLSYPHELENALHKLESVVAVSSEFTGHYPPRWLALKLLEDDEHILKRLDDVESRNTVAGILHDVKKHILAHSGEDSQTAVVEARYGIASGIFRAVVKLKQISGKMFTDHIDAVVCSRYLGPLILLAIVYGLFAFVFKISDELKWIPLFNGDWVSPVGLFEHFFEYMGFLAKEHIGNKLLHSLISDAFIAGVGGVMCFVPLIFFMFLFIAVLEDTGYIARVAFILDRVMRVFGLQGKSILALIISGGLGGGGCAVPGIMAARTLREEKDRLVTMLVVPLMNCGAKFPVYAVLIAAFFSHSRGLMMFILWLLSWIFALVAGFTLRKWVIKGEQTPFVMELPIYHIPTLKGVLIHTWYRTWLYIKKAGTVILGVSVILWAMMYFPRIDSSNFETARSGALRELEQKLVNTKYTSLLPLTEKKLSEMQEEFSSFPAYLEYEKKISAVKIDEAREQLLNSFAGRLGSVFAPVSKLAGFDWRDNIALIGGFAAKEVVIGTLGTAYSLGSDDEGQKSLSARLAADKNWSPLRAFALMVFVMVYAPCFVAVLTIKRESGSWKWALFSTLYSTTAAFIIAVLIYQLGGLFF